MKRQLVLVVLLQTLVLLAMIAKKQWTLATGTPVVLATAPIDPRSLFRGDYVQLNYKISTLRLDSVAGDRNFKKHEQVFVLLQPGETDAKPISVHRQRPSHTAQQVVLKGEVEWVVEDAWLTASVPDSLPSEAWLDTLQQKHEGKIVTQINVRYGIENYFVPEGQGRVLEQPNEDETIAMRVAIDRFGNAGIQAVLVNGKERYREKLF
ncbi:GDYXXLXY domain-containing protein [candidate division KSB1 bacterium]|nr:GDYXXLXY domain-containing protein [candidate division KSB1 bacterium]